MSSLCNFLLRNRRVRTASCVFLRNVSSGSSDSCDNFIPIYKSPIVQGCSAVNRAKKVSLIATATFVPISLVSYAAGLVDGEFPIYVASFGIITTAGSFCLGQVMNRMIGYIYISEDAERIKISYINFWGKRTDVIHEIKEISQITYPSRPFDRFFRILEMYSSDPYRISFRYGIVLKPGLFKDIFNYDCNEDVDYE